MIFLQQNKITKSTYQQLSVALMKIVDITHVYLFELTSVGRNLGMFHKFGFFFIYFVKRTKIQAISLQHFSMGNTEYVLTKTFLHS